MVAITLIATAAALSLVSPLFRAAEPALPGRSASCSISALVGKEAKETNRALQRFSGLVSQLAQSGGVLLVDGDNTRGKSAFSLSHEALVARTARWASRCGLEGRLVVLIDHGSSPTAFHLPQLGGAAVAFSGPADSADDVAARDVGWFHRRGHDVMLVTADSGLIQRCRRSASGRSLVVAPPQALIAAIGHDSTRAPARPPSSAAPPSSLALDEAHLAALESEMRARAAVTRAQRQVRPRVPASASECL